MALPSILANITVPLVGIVDIAIAGHISDASAIGGIAIGAMLFDLLYWNFGFLRIGTGGLTAQAFGRNNTEESVCILTKGLKTAFTAAFIILLLQWVFVTAVLAVTPCTATVSQFARQYFFIRVWAAPATLSLLVFKGWFIGMQDTVSPMVCDITVNIVNMLASYILAIYTPLGAIGVAHGTVIAQYIGLSVATTLYLTKYPAYRIFRNIRSIRNILNASSSISAKSYFHLNATLFIRSLCFMGIYIGFTTINSSYGDTPLALGAIMMKLFMLLSFFVDGFAYAGEALTGRFIGAKSSELLHQSIRCIMRWTLVIGIFFTMLFMVCDEQMVALMTNDTDIIVASRPFQSWLIVMPLLGCFAFAWDGVFVGATQGRRIMMCMIYAVIGFFITYFSLQPVIGLHAVYAAYFMHLLIRTVYLSIRSTSITVS